MHLLPVLSACALLFFSTRLFAEETKGTSAEKKNPPGAYSDMMPSTAQPTEQPATTDAQLEAAKNSRWIDPSKLKSDKIPNKPTTSSTTNWSASCTDRSGKVFKANTEGYDTCMQQMSMDAKMQQEKDKELKKDSDSNSDSQPAAGAGVEVKFGN